MFAVSVMKKEKQKEEADSSKAGSYPPKFAVNLLSSGGVLKFRLKCCILAQTVRFFSFSLIDCFSPGKKADFFVSELTITTLTDLVRSYVGLHYM